MGTFTSSPSLLSFLLLSSFVVLFLLAPRFFVTPKSIPFREELEDLALFRRATLADTSSSYQPPPTSTGIVSPFQNQKIAFLFLTNSDLSFAPLWERFFCGHARLFNIYIHADPTVRITPPGDVFRHRFIPGKPTQRASPNLISAARRLMAAALLDDPANEFFALVSQHCVPIHSFRFVYKTLFSQKSSGHRQHRSFIEILTGDPGIWDRYIARGDNVMTPEVPFEKFRVGSQFFILTRRHAVMVLRDRILWSKFRLPCLKDRVDSCYPEEHYFPTLLSMHDSDGCSHYTLTRVNWTDSVGGHPHLYGPTEVSGELVKELRKSNSTYSYLFARKFSPECLEPLLAIADTVIFRD